MTEKEDSCRDQIQVDFGDIAGGLAHDLNNIFAIVLSNVRFARRELGDDSPVSEDLSDIAEVADRGVLLVDRLRAIAGRLALRPQVQHPGPLVSGAMTAMTEALGGEDRLELSIAEDLPMVKIEGARLSRALVDIVSAVFSTSGKEGNVVLEVEPVDGGPDASPGVRILVSGLGHRVQREALVGLMRPYFMVNGSKITGLEVAAAKGFIDQSGGEMVMVEEGGAPAIEIWLPEASPDEI